MRNCGDCEGPLTRCPACGHYHCDDPGCIPPECAQQLQADDENQDLGLWVEEEQ